MIRSDLVTERQENHLVTDGLYVFEQHRKQNKRSETEI